MVLKIKATRASVKALRGYEHVGAAVSPSTNHTNTSQHERQGKVLTPCSQQSCEVKCISQAFTLAGLRLEVFPALTGLFLQKMKDTHKHTTRPPVLCPWHTQSSIIRLCLGAKRFKQTKQFPLNDNTSQKHKDASTITHHSPLHTPTHKC